MELNFFNIQLYKFIVEREKIKFTRSRPYRKNDAAHVEQKNFTHVRELFGYERLDFDHLTFDMDSIYRSYFNVLHNFFVPQQKLISKTRIGSKYVKEYDAPLTPYQRVMLSPFVPKNVKADLRKK